MRGGRSRRHYGLLTEGAKAFRKSRTMMDTMWEEVDLESTKAVWSIPPTTGVLTRRRLIAHGAPGARTGAWGLRSASRMTR